MTGELRSAPKALVLAGDGINCEEETRQAFDQVGFQSEIIHINDLIRRPQGKMGLAELSQNYSVLALPGGFSFGDDLQSGKILALKLRYGLGWDLGRYARDGGMVIGICNGFQALIRMGVFGKDVSITHNLGGKFMNTWVRVTPSSQKCVWLRGIGLMELPVRNGEGRIVLNAGNRMAAYNKLEQQGMLALRYEYNLNGSEEGLAGLCDPTGRILGLMPHPEAYARFSAHPDWTAQASGGGASGEGLHLFENAYNEVMNRRSSL